LVILSLVGHFLFNGAQASLPDINSHDILNRAQEIIKDKPSKGLGQCSVCKSLVASFDKGLKSTARGKFEGGDTDWEESRLGSYQDSELRLIEIQEKLCSDVSTGKDQCHNLAEDAESHIETWWFKKKNEAIQLYDYLCIEVLKACCPSGKFGKECTPCEGYPDKICSGHGSCIGNGTRKGSGKCNCEKGYKGLTCNACAEDFLQTNEVDSEEIVCEACDRSCLGHCRALGPKGCEVCREGYLWDQDDGCLDIDECVGLGYNPCKTNTFCVNTEGSHECYECDKSCDGCNGDGPDFCLKCATDFEMKEGVCTSTKKKQELKILEASRYATYFGLCVATCIIFRKNILIASFIGLMVAVYIGVAEYTIREAPPLNPAENLGQALSGMFGGKAQVHQ
jgi:hypothetical protein